MSDYKPLEEIVEIDDLEIDIFPATGAGDAAIQSIPNWNTEQIYKV